MKDEKLKAIIEAMQGITYLEWKKLLPFRNCVPSE